MKIKPIKSFDANTTRCDNSPMQLEIVTPIKFFPPSELARLVGRKERSVLKVISAGRLIPDAMLMHEQENPTALFSENTVKTVSLLQTLTHNPK